MIIETEIKTQLKAQRLEQLKRRYFELELDRIALEATGDTEGAKATLDRMENVQKAFDAVESIQV